MKRFNKHILEAVNRGIKLALDNFDNEVPISQSISKVKSRDLTSEWLDILPLVVDLGLPSGTLWAKYNVGVNLDDLDTYDKWYGIYVAWGELKSKGHYEWENYKWCNRAYTKLTKYCIDPCYGANHFVDKIKQLLLEDDIAFLTDSRFKMPTNELYDELLRSTTQSWVNNYMGIKDLCGILHKSAFNSEELFFPAGGYKNNYGLTADGFASYYWSSTLHILTGTAAYRYSSLDSSNDYQYNRNNTLRSCGLNVRGVVNQ